MFKASIAEAAAVVLGSVILNSSGQQWSGKQIEELGLSGYVILENPGGSFKAGVGGVQRNYEEGPSVCTKVPRHLRAGNHPRCVQDCRK